MAQQSILDSNGPIDNLGSALLVVVGTLWFLALGLQLDAGTRALVYVATCFGLLTPAKVSLDVGFSMTVCDSGPWALAVAALNLSSFLGRAEARGTREARHFVNLVTYAAFFGTNLTFCMGSAEGFSPFIMAWLGVDVVMTLAYAKWVWGSEIGKKFKIA